MKLDWRAWYTDVRRWLKSYQKHPGLPRVTKSILTGSLRIDPSATIQGSHVTGSVTIGPEVILKGCHIEGHVNIGDYSVLESPCIVLAKHHAVTIGKFCSIAWNTNIINQNHDFQRPSTHYMGVHVFGEQEQADMISKGPITIGNDVWIGAGTFILPGVSVGDGAVIAAGSVVVTSIPPYAVAAGVPAKIIRYRFDEETITKLAELQWWNWSPEQLKQNREFFLHSLDFSKIQSR